MSNKSDEIEVLGGTCATCDRWSGNSSQEKAPCYAIYQETNRNHFCKYWLKK